jgi:hypothetical protein
MQNIFNIWTFNLCALHMLWKYFNQVNSDEIILVARVYKYDEIFLTEDIHEHILGSLQLKINTYNSLYSS